MPRYTFQCPCGFRHSRTLPIGDYPTTSCPKCQQAATRVLDTFGFRFKASKTAAPANTGVAKDDFPTADTAVGRDADARWAEHEAREFVKNRVREVGGHRAIVRETHAGYIEYKAAGEPLLKTRRKINNELKEVLRRPAK